MGYGTEIEWCDHTFNPWWGCVKVSEACRNCYAERIARRFGVGWGPEAARRPAAKHYWREPLRWDRIAAREGVRRTVFCGSMCDVLENNPQLDPLRVRLFQLIERTPHLFWLLLSKRMDTAWTVLERCGYDALPQNAALGCTVENQEMAEKRIPNLLAVPAVMHFVSCEPLLGPLNLSEWLPVETIGGVEMEPLIDWVIVGGESGWGSRPMEPDWVRGIRDQCVPGVPFFFKQWGEFGPVKGDKLVRMGKKVAGSTLDGREWKEFPEVIREAVTA